MKTKIENSQILKQLLAAITICVSLLSFVSNSAVAQPAQQEGDQADAMGDDEDQSDDVDSQGNSSPVRFNEWQPGQFRPEPEALRRAVQNEQGTGGNDSGGNGGMSDRGGNGGGENGGGGEFRRRRNAGMNDGVGGGGYGGNGGGMNGAGNGGMNLGAGSNNGYDGPGGPMNGGGNGGGEIRRRRNAGMNGGDGGGEGYGGNGVSMNGAGNGGTNLGARSDNGYGGPGGRMNGGGNAGGPRNESRGENSDSDGGGQQARLHDVDDLITAAMQQYSVPGASIAIAHQGKLVYVKTYGVANIRTNEPVTDTTFFNLGSCTKAVSMFGVLRLQEQGKLNLDDTVYNVIGQPQLPRRQCDPRVFQITVRQLLHHSGGWNDDSGFIKASKEVRRVAPNGMPYKDAVRILFMTPLDYAPGTKAKYANGQWNLIKYVIACAAQMPYGEFMKRQLASIGITDMHNESKGHVDGEATRYTGSPPRAYPSGQRDVALEPAFGNWMATSVDMVKFLTALDGSRVQGISRESFAQMVAPLPPPMVNDKDGSHFGLGMDVVRDTDKGVFFSKNGAKPGVHCQIQHLPIGVDFCIMMNGGAQAADGSNVNPMPIGKISMLMNRIQQWPDRDLFARYSDGNR